MIHSIETIPSLEGFFAGLLAEALEAERLDLSEPARAYLVQLAKDFAQRDALYQGGLREERGTPALFWLYEKAMTAPPSQQFEAYRHLGDVALFVSGFFAPQIERSMVDVDYYVRMGGTAYDRASICAGSSFRQIMAQLARAFGRLVEVFARVAESTTLPVKRDIGTIYERWFRNPENDDLTERLAAQGLFPLRAIAKGA